MSTPLAILRLGIGTGRINHLNFKARSMLNEMRSVDNCSLPFYFRSFTFHHKNETGPLGQEELAVIHLQRIARGGGLRIRRKKHLAAVEIQKVARGGNLRIHRKRNIAATQIQKVARGGNMRIHRKRNTAATEIQRVAR